MGSNAALHTLKMGSAYEGSYLTFIRGSSVGPPWVPGHSMPGDTSDGARSGLADIWPNGIMGLLQRNQESVR